MLSRKIINIYNDIARKHGDITVKHFRKYEKLQYKRNKLKLDIDFLNNCKQIGVYPKFLIFKLRNVSNKDVISIRKRLLRRAINKRNKELQHVSKDLSLSENFLSKQLSIIHFYILTKSLTSHNKKSLLESLYILNRKSYHHSRRIAAYLYLQVTKLLLTSHNMNYHRKNLTYLKQVYTFQSNHIKFEDPKSSLPLKRSIVPLLTILNPTKPKVR